MRFHFITWLSSAASFLIATNALAQSVQTGHARPSSTAAIVVEVGHHYQPAAPAVAPGELITLYVYGVGTDLASNYIATSKPLPTVLAGISVQMHQPIPLLDVAVPIYSVIPYPACNWWPNTPPIDSRCGTVAGITIQVPFELDVPGGFGPPAGPVFGIFENGQKRAQIDVGPSRHQVHVATTGEDVRIQIPELQIGYVSPVIRHLDKYFINEYYPAMPGETLSMWAVGLGQGVGPVKAATGQPAPEGVVVEPGIDFQWGQNVKPRAVNWPIGGPRPADGILSAGMVPGQVGIYEILFKVPDTIPADVPACVGQGSNLTVSIGFLAYENNFDGGGICVYQPTATARSEMARYLIHAFYQKLAFADPDTFPYAQSPAHFADVPASWPQYKWIQRMAELGIASDTASDCTPGNFCPDAQITNGEIAVFIVRAFQLLSNPCATSQAGCDPSIADAFTINSQTPYYQDVPPSHPYFRWIQKAKELNIFQPNSGACFSGLTNCPDYCPPGNFCPSGLTHVLKMTTYIGRALLQFR